MRFLAGLSVGFLLVAAVPAGLAQDPSEFVLTLEAGQRVEVLRLWEKTYLTYAFAGFVAPQEGPPVEWIWVVCSDWTWRCYDYPRPASWSGSMFINPFYCDCHVSHYLHLRALEATEINYVGPEGATFARHWDHDGLLWDPNPCLRLPPYADFCRFQQLTPDGPD